jgi:hypothetical protein
MHVFINCLAALALAVEEPQKSEDAAPYGAKNYVLDIILQIYRYGAGDMSGALGSKFLAPSARHICSNEPL